MANNPYEASRSLFDAERKKGEKRYKRLLNSLMRQLRTALKQARSPFDLQRILDNITYSARFDAECRKAATEVITMLAKGQAHSWRAAAMHSSRGREIYKALMSELKGTPRGAYIDTVVNENAKLIKTVPQNLAQKFSQMAKRSEYAGMRPEELTKELLSQAPYLTDVEARRIARTESSKAATALVEARAVSIGLEFYVWSCVTDERSRDSHKLMDGVVCRWDDAPNPERANGEKRDYGSYHAGCIFNCRCCALPVVDDLDLKFPLRCWHNGRIQRVDNLTRFKRLYGLSDDSLRQPQGRN